MLISGVLSCSIEMCLRRTVESNKITLICKIANLIWPVDFIDNHRKEIAHCTMPTPAPKCRPIDENAKDRVHVEQFQKTNETILVVTGTIDKRFNGNWSCHHGDILKESVNIQIHVAKGIILISYTFAV